MEIGQVRLMGTTEIGEYLGYTRQRVWTLVNDRRKGFPAPRWTLAKGDIWWADEVEAWAGERNLPATAEDPETD